MDPYRSPGTTMSSEKVEAFRQLNEMYKDLSRKFDWAVGTDTRRQLLYSINEIAKQLRELAK